MNHTIIGIVIHPIPDVQGYIRKYAEVKFHEESGTQSHVDHEGSVKEWKKSPLVVVIFHTAMVVSPHSLETVE